MQSPRFSSPCGEPWEQIASINAPPNTRSTRPITKSIDTIGEIYVASRVVDFLRQVMPQLESLALTTTLAMLLMLFAVSSYPFPARDALLWFSWMVVFATVGSMMWMFFSLNRDRVASMIAGTTPGQTDWNSTLILQVATHALLPILVLLGAAFPAESLERWSRGSGAYSVGAPEDSRTATHFFEVPLAAELAPADLRLSKPGFSASAFLIVFIQLD